MSDAPVRARVRSAGVRPALAGWLRTRWRPALATIALAAAALPFVARLVGNLPGASLGLPAGSYDAVVALATVGPALAALGFAAGASRRTERVGFAGLAAFASLSLAGDGAYLPAAVGVTGFGGVLVWRALDRDRTPAVRVRLSSAVFGGAAVAAVAAALGATTGSAPVAPVAVRRAGTVLAVLAAVAAAPARSADRLDAAVGAVAASLVYVAGSTAPYVTGAVALVVGGAVGASLPLLAVGVGGVAAATTAALRRRSLVGACGGLLLLVAGVPVTVSRALAVALGAVFLLGTGGLTDE